MLLSIQDNITFCGPGSEKLPDDRPHIIESLYQVNFFLLLFTSTLFIIKIQKDGCIESYSGTDGKPSVHRRAVQHPVIQKHLIRVTEKSL